MSTPSFSEAPVFGARRAVGRLRLSLLGSIGASTGWVAFTLLYVAFWAHGFSVFQSVVVVVVSLLVLGAFLAGAWISFGLGFVRHWVD